LKEGTVNTTHLLRVARGESLGMKRLQSTVSDSRMETALLAGEALPHLALQSARRRDRNVKPCTKAVCEREAPALGHVEEKVTLSGRAKGNCDIFY